MRKLWFGVISQSAPSASQGEQQIAVETQLLLSGPIFTLLYGDDAIKSKSLFSIILKKDLIQHF